MIGSGHASDRLQDNIWKCRTGANMDATRERSTPAMKERRPAAPPSRVEITMHTAAAAGLTEGKKERLVSLRVSEKLLRVAQRMSGLKGRHLLEFALAKVALEDDYAGTLKELRGSVRRDADLEL